MSYEDLSASDAKDLLRKWRENNERRSSEVLELWVAKLGCDEESLSTVLANEKYVILEQVIYAALDRHSYDLARMCILKLHNEFPGSSRVQRYKAALLEAEDKHMEALEVLDKILKEDETNAAAHKRVVAILKAQGLLNEAIRELVDYLKKFMADVEAWQELCELYVQAGELARAAFCAEELLLHQPHNHMLHQRLADIKYTMGGVENLETAKSYYSQALKLNPDNMRALLGLFLVTNSLLTCYKSGGNSQKRKDLWKLAQWVQTTAARKHLVRKTDTAPALSQMMLNLAITE